MVTTVVDPLEAVSLSYAVDNDSVGDAAEWSDEDLTADVAATVADTSAPAELNANFVEYYTAQRLCDAETWQKSLDLLRQPLPPAFRLIGHCGGTDAISATAARARDDTVQLLEELAPWTPVEVPWCAGAYRLLNAGDLGPKGRLQDSRLNQILVGAQRAGRISRQETASMLPALALQVEPHHSVLDICAAPGSKTIQLLELLHAGRGDDMVAPPRGLLVANDLKSKRLARLTERAKRSPTAPLLTTCSDARRYPNLIWRGERCGRVRFDRVLCDAPCSCDGTVRKTKGLLANWNPRGGLCHHGDQLAILSRGLEMLAPGGLLAYSTCSLNPVENEAVVAAALGWGQGCVELVNIQVSGLSLAQGLQEWRVPAPSKEVEDVQRLYSFWEEVPLEVRNTKQVRRTMFPPAKDAASIRAQLPLCGRLLPAHDDGGCFFLAMFRRVQHVEVPLKRGDKVYVLSAGSPATVRGPGTGPFKGLIRIAYPDGTFYHARAEDLQRQSESMNAIAVNGDNGGGHDDVPTTDLAPQIVPASESDWQAVADFYGLISDPDHAVAMGVNAFPREALVYGPDPHFDFTSFAKSQALDTKEAEKFLQAFGPAGAADAVGGVSLCLASESLRSIGSAPNPRPVGRTIFFRSKAERSYSGDQHKIWPEDVFDWRPASEAAQLLVQCCTKRIAQVPGGNGPAKLRQLIKDLEGEPAAYGVDSSWASGPVLLVGAPGVVLIGLLHGTVLRPVFQKGYNARALNLHSGGTANSSV